MMIDDTNKTYTISELCREFDVTPRTLRFYEAKGLLHPTRDGARRRFDARDRARLRLILRGKRFGFSLIEIGEMLDLYDRSDGNRAQIEDSIKRGRSRLAGMERQRADLDDAIDELKEQLAGLEEMLANDPDKTS